MPQSSAFFNCMINYTIIFVQVKSSKEYLDRRFFQRHSAVESSQYINSREVTGRYELKPGKYCVVPTTFEPNEVADFVLRIFSEGNTGMR